MTIEEEILKDSIINFDKLLAYGFKIEGNNYVFEKIIYHDEFKAIINITRTGKLEGKIFDLSINEEFYGFRLKDVEGSFINSIKEEYIQLLTHIKEKCFTFSKDVKSWVVPANPKLYDVISHFEKYNIITWKQPINVKVNDLVYIYMGSPYSCILFKCEAIKVNIIENNINTMEIKLLKKYDKDLYTLEKLKKFDLKGVRCPRSLPEKLSKFLEKN